MEITKVRRLLTKKQMDRLTEEALEGGPFLVQNIKEVGRLIEVDVYWPKTNRTKTFTV